MFSFSHRVTVYSLLGVATASLLSSTPVQAEFASLSGQKPEISQVKGQAKQQTLVEVAVAAGSFKTLTAALEAAGLVEVLQGTGPFTVFAPTDEAFAALPKGTVENLLKPENKETLVKILTYHVVPGRVLSSDLKAGKVATVEGSDLNVKLGKPVKVNDASVVQVDVKASNGVIHVIDRVILPPN